MKRHCKPAFTLAELLIALTILGVIATFTIPKVLQAQRNQAWNSAFKEEMAAFSQAYVLYKQNNTITASTSTQDFTPYLNYVKLDTTSVLDNYNGSASPWQCSWNFCLQLHNGAEVYIDNATTFGTAAPNSYISFPFDPDGKNSGLAAGPGKSQNIVLYFNGRVTTANKLNPTDTTYLNGSPNAGEGWSEPVADWESW